MGRSLQLIRRHSIICHNPSVNASSGASTPIIDHSHSASGSVVIGMYPSLMGTFNCPTVIFMMGSIFGGASSSLNSMYFHTTHMEYPWILPSPIPSIGPIETDVPLPATMVAYQENLD